MHICGTVTKQHPVEASNRRRKRTFLSTIVLKQQLTRLLPNSLRNNLHSNKTREHTRGKVSWCRFGSCLSGASPWNWNLAALTWNQAQSSSHSKQVRAQLWQVKWNLLITGNKFLLGVNSCISVLITCLPVFLTVSVSYKTVIY